MTGGVLWSGLPVRRSRRGAAAAAQYAPGAVPGLSGDADAVQNPWDPTPTPNLRAIRRQVLPLRHPGKIRAQRGGGGEGGGEGGERGERRRKKRGREGRPEGRVPRLSGDADATAT